MNTTHKPMANPMVVLREEFDDWAILFNPETAEAAGINPVGVEVWKNMDGKKNLEDIVLKIKDNFDTIPDSAPEEISTFIEELSSKGFVGYELKNSSDGSTQ